MEASESKEGTFLECTLCFENDDLKRLPCNPGHIYCVTCLTKDSEVTKIIKCPLCRTVFDEEIDEIPSAGAPLDKFLCCDVCMRKDDRRRLAQIYCVICSKKFCTPHEKSHNDALDDHMRIRMDEYKRDYRKMETRYCEKHPKKVYSITCGKCAKVMCADCVDEMVPCLPRSNHELTSITKLVAKVTDTVNEKKVWIFDKEEHLLGMSKQLTAVISDWDTETQQMIEKLHKSRDEHVAELLKRYSELEVKLVELRNISKTEVTSFLDDEIGSLLDKLSRQVARIDKKLYTYHEVDVAVGYQETESLVNELMKMKIPKYQPSSNCVEVIDKDFVDIQPAIDISPSTKQLINVYTSVQLNPPKSMKLIKTIKLPSTAYAVAKCGNATLAGLETGSILKVLVRSDPQSVLAKSGSIVSSIQVYNNEIYVFSEYTGKVTVYDLSGNVRRSWVHKSSGGHHNKLRVVNNKVIVPNRCKRSLTVYSIQGQLIKQVVCPDISNGPKTLSICGDDSVIVSDCDTSSVLRVNIDSGEVMWTSKHVTNPQGVVCYKDRYVLITNHNSETKICILDIDTGDYIGQLCGAKGTPSQHRDLDIDGDMLIVPKSDPVVLQYYQLITE